ADIGGSNGYARAEAARSQTICVDVSVYSRRTLPSSWTLIGHDNLAAIWAGSHSDTPEATAGRRDALLRVERSVGTETCHGCPTRNHASARIPINPYAAVTDRD